MGLERRADVEGLLGRGLLLGCVPLLSGEFNRRVRRVSAFHTVHVHSTYCAKSSFNTKRKKEKKLKNHCLQSCRQQLWCALPITLWCLDQEVGCVRASTLILPQLKQEWDDSNPQSHKDKQPKAASCLLWAEDRRWICVESKWFHSNGTVKGVSCWIFFFPTVTYVTKPLVKCRCPAVKPTGDRLRFAVQWLKVKCDSAKPAEHIRKRHRTRSSAATVARVGRQSLSVNLMGLLTWQLTDTKKGCWRNRCSILWNFCKRLTFSLSWHHRKTQMNKWRKSKEREWAALLRFLQRSRKQTHVQNNYRASQVSLFSMKDFWRGMTADSETSATLWSVWLRDWYKIPSQFAFDFFFPFFYGKSEISLI